MEERASQEKRPDEQESEQEEQQEEISIEMLDEELARGLELVEDEEFEEAADALGEVASLACQLFGPISVDVSKYFYYYADAFLSLHERNVESSLFAGIEKKMTEVLSGKKSHGENSTDASKSNSSSSAADDENKPGDDEDAEEEAEEDPIETVWSTLEQARLFIRSFLYGEELHSVNAEDDERRVGEEAIRIVESKVYDRENAEDVRKLEALLADVHIRLAAASMMANTFDAAILELNRALAIRRNVYGEESREVAEVFFQLGLAQRMDNKFTDALESYQHAKRILESAASAIQANELRSLEEHQELSSLRGVIEEVRTLVSDVEAEIIEEKEMVEQKRRESEEESKRAELVSSYGVKKLGVIKKRKTDSESTTEQHDDEDHGQSSSSSGSIGSKRTFSEADALPESE